MCTPSPPPPPDYAGAAQAQGAANIESARATAKLSNPNVDSPYGTQTVTYGVNGDPDQAHVKQTFSPEQQALYEKSTQTKGLLGDLGIQGASALGYVIGKNLDLSGLPAAPSSAQGARDDVINAIMSRIDESTGRQREQSNSDLIAAGIRPGTEAYSRAMDQIDRQYNDARQQAILAGGQETSRDVGIDTQLRKDAIAELLAQRQTPLNEVTALTSGSQVSNPFASGLGYQAGANVAPAPIFQAAQAQGAADQNLYNAKAANSSANFGSLVQAGGALGSIYSQSSFF